MQALTFFGIDMKIYDIEQITIFSWNTLYDLKKWVFEKRYDFTIILVIYNIYIKNTHKNKKLSISLEK